MLLVTLVLSGISLFNAFLILIGLGIFNLLVYRTGRRLVHIVDEINNELPAVVKALSDTLASTGSIPTAVSSLVNAKWKYSLRPLKRLNARLRAGINLDTAWKMFQGELSSALAGVVLSLFIVGQKIGIEPKQCVEVLLDIISLKQNTRRRRVGLASYARGIVIPLQGAVVGVSVLLITILDLFGRISKLAAGVSLPSNFMPGIFLAAQQAYSAQVAPFVFFFIVMLIIFNCLFIYSIEGGSLIPFIQQMSFSCLVSGITGVFAINASEILFQQMLPIWGG
jgi:archaellum biogenesis protein FlaJ (TadC family)